jgi:hypothetical protein
MYKFSFYVPESHLEIVKLAVFNAGAGKYSNYEHCAWQVLGQGQFKPLPGSHPFIGKQNEVEHVAEYKVEMICEEKYIGTVIKALKASHPYEEPAFEIYKIIIEDMVGIQHNNL